MDGQPNRKKSKGGGVKNIASFSVEPASVDKGRMENSDFRNKDYFTPAVMDVWPKILDYVTDPKDVVSVMNASPLFHDLLKKRKAPALLPLVLPVLLKQKRIALARHDVFNCRLLNKQVKASVDDLLANERQLQFGYIRQRSWMLIDDEAIQAFMEGTQGITGNPFLRRRCELSLDYEGEELSNVMEILRRFGCVLLRVCFKLSLNSSPRRALRVFKRALRYLSNVQRLELDFSDIDEEEWHRHKTIVSHTPFPLLEALRTFEFKCYYLMDFDHNHPQLSTSLGSFVRTILKTYGNQLTSLEFDNLSLIGEPWRSLDFADLLDLKVLFYNIQESNDKMSQVYANLAKLECPKLEGLIVWGCGMGVTAETFLTLNRFRESLRTLQFTESLGDETEPFQVDPLDVQEFPHVTRLTLCILDVETPFRHLFRMMFTKLQELRFEPTGLSAYPPPVPDETIRRSYFTIFPHLRQITWLQRWGMKPTVFTR